jgi:transcriptional regulator with XRE-family HTH domain
VPRKKASTATKENEGARLKNLRRQMSMTVRELGKEFQVGFSSISQWENGEHAIPGSVLKLMEIYEQRLADRRQPE